MLVTVALTGIALLYAAGLIRVRARAGRHHGPSTARVLSMAAGLLVIEIAVAGPLEDWAGHRLAAHMVQHLALMLVAAPLWVAARPTPYLVWGLPLPLRKLLSRMWNSWGLSTIIRMLDAPALRWAIFCAAVILWHVPALYRWAMGGDFRHALMNTSFLGSAMLFWAMVIAPTRRSTPRPAVAGLYVLSAALVTGLPGALITFARQPLYLHDHARSMSPGSALADQQLAGLIMWIPMDLLLFGVALACFAAAVRREASAGGRRRLASRVGKARQHAIFRQSRDSDVHGPQSSGQPVLGIAIIARRRDEQSR